MVSFKLVQLLRGAILGALTRPQTFGDVPKDDVGAFGLVVQEIEALASLLHLLDLVGGQVHESFNLLLKTLHALTKKRQD